MRRRGAVAIVALAMLGSPSRASVTDVGGSQSSVLEFHFRRTYETTGTYTQHRLALPTAYNALAAHHLFVPLWVSLETTDSLDVPADCDVTPYNTGALNSGAWITLYNPHPGTKYVYRIHWAVHGVASSAATSVDAQCCRWSPMATYYLDPTLHVVLFDPALDAALAGALASHPVGPQPGVRGDLERIAMCVQELDDRTPDPGVPDRNSHEVLMDGYGDCDDLVKVQCALHREYGVPSRCLLTGVLDLGAPGLTQPSSIGLHAIGEYWTGTSWEGYEPHATTNFPLADQMVIGTGEDFDEIYPQINLEAYPVTSGPVSCSGSLVQSSVGSYAWIATRVFGTARQFATPAPEPLGTCAAGTPHDVVRIRGDVASAPEPVRGGLASAIRLDGNPARGAVRMHVRLSRPARVTAKLYDAGGREVCRFFDGALAEGEHEMSFVDEALAPGVYHVLVTSNGARLGSRRVVYLGRSEP